MDVARLSIDTPAIAGALPVSVRSTRHRLRCPFLKGPIPLWWLQRAAIAGRQGAALKVAIALWFQFGLQRDRGVVKLRSALLRDLGVLRHAGYRGLAVLESAGLVAIARAPGRLPEVTLILDAEPSSCRP
jgi:hypothetical protein